jgi:outer membrane protein insertion porin family
MMWFGRRAGVALTGWLVCASALVALAAEPAWQPATAPPVDAVVVALKPLGGSPQDVLPEPDRWLALLSDLVGAGAAAPEVRDAWLLEGHLLSFIAGIDPKESLRQRAAGLPVLLVSVSRLVDAYGLDAVLLEPTGQTRRVDTRSADGLEGLEAAFRVTAVRARAALGAAPGANPEPGEPPESEADAEPPDDAPAEAAAEATQEAAQTEADDPDEPSQAQPIAGPVTTPPEFGSEPAGEVRAAPAAPDAVARVVEIRVEGTRRISPDAIRAAVRMRVGDPISILDIGGDVRRVYDLGFFRDVQVVASDAQGGKVLTFVVDENPIVRQVSISGNENMGSDDIRENMTLTVGSTIDYPLLIENKERIKLGYAARGYYLASVSYTIEPLSEGAVSVNFEVEEGRKLRLVEVRFEGNEYFSDSQLRREMQTRPWSWKSPLTHFWDNSGLYAEPIFYQDINKVARKYMDSGFIHVRAGDPQVTTDESGLRVVVEIDEGAQFRIGSIDVIGDESMDREELISLVGMQEGAIFSRSGLSEDVERLQAFYADRGFFFAKVTPRPAVDEDTLVVDTSFEVEKGDLYFIERIEVRGNTRTRDQVVRRELSLGEGELYSADALQRSRARVQRLGFFEEVQVEARPTEEPQRVAVDVEVVERPTGSFSFGAGIGSDDGLLFNIALQQANLMGLGYALSANADIATRNKRFFLRFSNPYAFGSSASYGVTGFLTSTDFEDFDQEILGFDWTLGYPLDEGETRAFLGYSFTSRDITGFDVQATSMVQREEVQERGSTSLVSLAFRRDVRDDPRFPTEGHLMGGAIEFAGLGGLNNFLRTEFQTLWYKPLKEWLPFESTFVFHTRIGYVMPLNAISDFDLPTCTNLAPPGFASCRATVDDPANLGQVLPLDQIDTDLKLAISERYFVGGIGQFQLRGFRARTLGPRRSLIQPIRSFPNPNDAAYFPVGFSATGPNNCINPSGQCNRIQDTKISDFQNLDLTDVIGGNKFWVINFEVQFPISDELGLQGLVFFDMGNSFSENESITPSLFRFGTGAGVRWFSPFGPILLQLGFPLDALDVEDTSVFEFSFGGSPF